VWHLTRISSSIFFGLQHCGFSPSVPASHRLLHHV